MIGVKTHPWWQQYPVKKLEGVARWCEENGYPIQYQRKEFFKKPLGVKLEGSSLFE